MRVVHKSREPFTHYIGRPSIFGNPFVTGRDGTRDEVIRKFDMWARTDPKVMRAIEALPYDAVLGCFCAPKTCHGDMIVNLWHQLHKHDRIGDPQIRDFERSHARHGPCPECCNGAVVILDTGDQETSVIGTCTTCYGDSRQ